MKRRNFYLILAVAILLLGFSIWWLCDNKRKSHQLDTPDTFAPSTAVTEQPIPNPVPVAPVVKIESEQEECRYILGHWKDIPRDQVFSNLHVWLSDKSAFAFHLTTYKIFSREVEGKPTLFTTLSDGVWRTDFQFAPRTPEEIRALLSGLKMKMLVTPDVIQSRTSFCSWKDKFWFSKEEFTTRMGFYLREGIEFLVVNGEEYDAAYKEQEISFLLDYDGTRQYKAKKIIEWREPYASMLGLYKDPKGEAIYPASMEICDSEAFDYNLGFSPDEDDDLFYLRDGLEHQDILGVVVNGKLMARDAIYEPYSGRIFNAIFAASKEDQDNIFLIFERMSVHAMDSNWKEVEYKSPAWKQSLTEYDNIVKEYVRDIKKPS